MYGVCRMGFKEERKKEKGSAATHGDSAAVPFFEHSPIAYHSVLYHLLTSTTFLPLPSFSLTLSLLLLVLPTRSGRSRASLLTDIYCAQKCVWVVINLRIHTEILIYISLVFSPSSSLVNEVL